MGLGLLLGLGLLALMSSGKKTTKKKVTSELDLAPGPDAPTAAVNTEASHAAKAAPGFPVEEVEVKSREVAQPLPSLPTFDEQQTFGPVPAPAAADPSPDDDDEDEAQPAPGPEPEEPAAVDVQPAVVEQVRALPAAQPNAPAPSVEEVTTDSGALAAARALAAFVRETLKSGKGAALGTKGKPSEAVKQYQSLMGVTPDGIYGPETRKAGKALGVSMPVRA
jgi:hypothetical protein